MAVTMLESSPPESRAPTPTSAARNRSTALINASRTAASTSSGGSAPEPPDTAGRVVSVVSVSTRNGVNPSSGVQTWPGGNGSTSGRRCGSKALSSLAKTAVPSCLAQYSGAMPIVSRAAKKRPSTSAPANANMPHSRDSAAGPSASMRCRALSWSARVRKT